MRFCSVSCPRELNGFRWRIAEDKNTKLFYLVGFHIHRDCLDTWTHPIALGGPLTIERIEEAQRPTSNWDSCLASFGGCHSFLSHRNYVEHEKNVYGYEYPLWFLGKRETAQFIRSRLNMNKFRYVGGRHKWFRIHYRNHEDTVMAKLTNEEKTIQEWMEFLFNGK